MTGITVEDVTGVAVEVVTGVTVEDVTGAAVALVTGVTVEDVMGVAIETVEEVTAEIAAVAVDGMAVAAIDVPAGGTAIEEATQRT